MTVSLVCKTKQLMYVTNNAVCWDGLIGSGHYFNFNFSKGLWGSTVD